MRWLAALVLTAGAAVSGTCEDVTHDGLSFTVCRVTPAAEDLRLFLTDPDTGMVLGSFENTDRMLSMRGARLTFAMNAGMYHADRRPVGHYIENGQEVTPLITSDGPGNFGLLPNGVLCLGPDRATVVETLRYARARPDCRFATQSGPMLVIDGQLHPRFLPDSDSRYVRNGVGTTEDGATAWFVISNAPVTFHEFGRFFRDVLKTPQALYLDGNISRLYAPGLNRSDGGFPMGPIVGTVGRDD